MKYLKTITCLMITMLLYCSTSRILINKEDLTKVKTIAVFPFQTRSNVKQEVLSESQQLFNTCFKEAGYQIIEEHKIKVMMEKENLDQNDLTPSVSRQLALQLNADAILLGDILENSEEKTLIREYENEPARVKKVFIFQIQVKLISSANGNIILSLQNKYPQAIRDIEDIEVNIDTHRKEILNDLIKDLKAVLN